MGGAIRYLELTYIKRRKIKTTRIRVKGGHAIDLYRLSRSWKYWCSHSKMFLLFSSTDINKLFNGLIEFDNTKVVTKMLGFLLIEFVMQRHLII